MLTETRTENNKAQSLTVEQYRTITGGQIRASKSLGPITVLLPKESEESVIRHHLRSMGHYFDLPEKSVQFYIRQLELSGKI